MTESPGDLVAVQHYVQGRTGLPWDALGIKHGSPQGGGYHEGNDLLSAAGRLSSDYSKRESARDRPGTNSASAFDLGGDFGDFRRITLGIVHACQAGDPRTRDIREVIYTPNGQVVQRWDRLGVRSTGDSTHLSHTHISFFRDSEGRRAQADNFLGLLRELFEGTDMANAAETNASRNAWAVAQLQTSYKVIPGDADGAAEVTVSNPLKAKLDAIAMDAKAAASLSTTVTMTEADRAAIVADLAKLVPSAADIAVAVLDEQHRRDAA